LAGSDSNGIDVVREHLLAHLEHFTIRRARVIEMRDRILCGQHARVQQRMDAKTEPERAVTVLLHDLAQGGEIERAEPEITWATDALARVESVSA
jgi:PadR family transcriptional regulator AphA